MTLPPTASVHNRMATPSRPGPSQTRERILDAATPLFAARGAQATTVRQIASAAGVNSQLIYYYFDDKQGLFRAVLEVTARRVDVLLAEATRIDGPLRARLSHFIIAWVRVTLRQAPAVRLLHRAMLEGDEALSADIQRYAGVHAAAIGALIAQGVANGMFRADLDPGRAVASLVGMIQYLALAEPILFPATTLPDGREATSEAMARHTAELFLRGLDAR